MADERNATVDIEWIEPSVLSRPGSVHDVRFFDPEPAGPHRRVPSERALAAERWRGQWRDRYRRWHQLSLGAPSPRVDSVVRRVLRCHPSEAVVMVQARTGDTSGLEMSESLLTPDAAPLRRAAGRLCIPWSVPRVPVWLAVEPWWREQALVSLRLRSTRRWRYPVRYFGAAHRVMDQLVTPTSGSAPGPAATHQAAR